MITDTCESCKYAQKISTHEFECRRHSPNKNAGLHNIGMHNEVFIPRFPCVDETDWCGDFEFDPNLLLPH